MKRILAIGTHYDDVEIGLGGTLLKHINNGDEVFIVITDSNEYRTGNIDVRYQEQLDSLNILNIKNEQLIQGSTPPRLSTPPRISTPPRLSAPVLNTPPYSSGYKKSNKKVSPIEVPTTKEVLSISNEVTISNPKPQMKQKKQYKLTTPVLPDLTHRK